MKDRELLQEARDEFDTMAENGISLTIDGLRALRDRIDARLAEPRVRRWTCDRTGGPRYEKCEECDCLQGMKATREWVAEPLPSDMDYGNNMDIRISQPAGTPAWAVKDKTGNIVHVVANEAEEYAWSDFARDTELPANSWEQLGYTCVPVLIVEKK